MDQTTVYKQFPVDKYPIYSCNANAARFPVSGQGDTIDEPIERRIDQMTRSRNCLILALVFFIVLAFILVGVMIWLILDKPAAPTAPATTFKMQVASSHTGREYDAELGQSQSFGQNLMIGQFCEDYERGTSGVAVIDKCELSSFTQISGGTGTVGVFILTIRLYDLTPAQRQNVVVEAMMTYAGTINALTLDTSRIKIILE